MKDLDELLGSLASEGQHDSEGVFTTASKDAMRRLACRLLPGPHHYVLKLVQALVAAGASKVDVSVGMRSVEVKGQDVQPLDFPQTDWLRAAWEPGASLLKHLVTGLVGAWDQAHEIAVEWGTERLAFNPAEGLKPVPTSRPYGLEWDARLRVVRKKWAWTCPESTMQARLAFCPVEARQGGYGLLQASGFRTTGLAGPTVYSELLGAFATAVPGETPAALSVPDNVAAVCPVFFENADRPELFRSAQKPDAFVATWRPARRFYLLRYPMQGPAELIPVLHGVALDPFPVDLGVPGLVAACDLVTEGLGTDLSQFQVTRDAALGRLLDELRAEAAGVVERLPAMLKAWKPSFAGSLNSSHPATVAGFFMGAVGGMALGLTLIGVGPWHFLAFPGAMLGGYVGARLWRRSSSQRLTEYLATRERFGPPSGLPS